MFYFHKILDTGFQHWFQRGTNELKKYLRSRIEEPTAASGAPSTSAAPSSSGGSMSGIIGGSGEMDKHTVQSTKVLPYWSVAPYISLNKFSNEILSQ